LTRPELDAYDFGNQFQKGGALSPFTLEISEAAGASLQQMPSLLRIRSLVWIDELRSALSRLAGLRVKAIAVEHYCLHLRISRRRRTVLLRAVTPLRECGCEAPQTLPLWRSRPLNSGAIFDTSNNLAAPAS
jgi:hypothetical protein